MDILERVQKQANRVIKEVGHVSCEGSLNKLGLFSLEKRRFVNKYLMTGLEKTEQSSVQ